MRTIFAVLFVLLSVCTGCSKQYDHKGKTPLVELGGKFLYREDLQRALPLDISREDSSVFAEQYIRHWLEDALLYTKAADNIPDNSVIEKSVDDYRKSLIVHTYQQELIRQQLSKEISEADLQAYYEQNHTLFKLESPMLKGLFIKIPLSAPHLNNVRRWYKMRTSDAIDALEKYSLSNAVKYKYFYDDWLFLSEIQEMMPPLQNDNAEAYLDKNRQVEMKDTAFYYFLNVSDFLKEGDQKPLEYARPELQELLLNLKQVTFMQRVKNDLYNDALKKNEIKYYK
jgi:hypothetical protein